MKELANTLNDKLQNLKISEILMYFSNEYPEQVVFTTSMGAEDQVLTSKIAKTDKSIKIVTLDTGRLFQETYELIQRTESKFNIKINIIFPNNSSVEKMVNVKGVNLFYDSIENRKLCCNIRKIEPLKRALEGNKVWINGLRRDQSTTRNNINLVEFDEVTNVLKVNPLYNWTNEMVWEYIKNEKVPYNPLHDKNYPSIGCQPCTSTVEHGKDIRSGRWWWENPETRECGLHKR
ncbi:MAG: phosphoadenosine phosphosulfate reductase [Bacteroidetes bacterium GWA2_30_7]|nr:MAG: phosphoadenosine phosphosulfate reductase [Bacteroidetes bacterium GWA2_30_7]